MKRASFFLVCVLKARWGFTHTSANFAVEIVHTSAAVDDYCACCFSFLLLLSFTVFRFLLNSRCVVHVFTLFYFSLFFTYFVDTTNRENRKTTSNNNNNNSSTPSKANIDVRNSRLVSQCLTSCTYEKNKECRTKDILEPILCVCKNAILNAFIRTRLQQITIRPKQYTYIFFLICSHSIHIVINRRGIFFGNTNYT